MPSSMEATDLIVASDDPTQHLRNPLVPIQPPIRDSTSKAAQFKMVNVKVNGITRNVMVPVEVPLGSKVSPPSTHSPGSPSVSIIGVSPPTASKASSGPAKLATSMGSNCQPSSCSPGQMVSLLRSPVSVPQYIVVPPMPSTHTQDQRPTLVNVPSTSLAQTSRVQSTSGSSLSAVESDSISKCTIRKNEGIIRTPTKKGVVEKNVGGSSKPPDGDVIDLDDQWSDEDDEPLIHMVSPPKKPDKEQMNRSGTPRTAGPDDSVILVDDSPSRDMLPFPIPVPTTLATTPSTSHAATSDRNLTVQLDKSPPTENMQQSSGSAHSSPSHRRKCTPVKRTETPANESWLDTSADSELMDYLCLPGEKAGISHEGDSKNTKAGEEGVLFPVKASSDVSSKAADPVPIMESSENEFDSTMFRIDSIYSLADMMPSSRGESPVSDDAKCRSPAPIELESSSPPVESKSPPPSEVVSESPKPSGIDGHIMFPNLSRKLAQDTSGDVNSLSLIDEGREVLRGDYHQVLLAKEAIRQLQAAELAGDTFSAYPLTTTTDPSSVSQHQQQTRTAPASVKHPCYSKILSTPSLSWSQNKQVVIQPTSLISSSSLPPNVSFSAVSQQLKQAPRPPVSLVTLKQGTAGKSVITFQPRAPQHTQTIPGVRQTVRLPNQPQQPGNQMMVYVVSDPKNPSSQIRYVSPAQLSGGQSLIQRPGFSYTRTSVPRVTTVHPRIRPGMDTSFSSTVIPHSTNPIQTGRVMQAAPGMQLGAAPVRRRRPGPLSKTRGVPVIAHVDLTENSNSKNNSSKNTESSSDVIVLDDDQPVSTSKEKVPKKKKKKKVPRRAKHVNKWRRTHPSYFRCATLCVNLKLGKRKYVDARTFKEPEIPAKVLKKYRPIRYRTDCNASRGDSSGNIPLTKSTHKSMASSSSTSTPMQSGKSMQIVYINGKEYCYYTDSTRHPPQHPSTVGSVAKPVPMSAPIASGMNFMKIGGKEMPLICVPPQSSNQIPVKSLVSSPQVLPVNAPSLTGAPLPTQTMAVNASANNVIWISNAPGKGLLSLAKPVPAVKVTPSVSQPLSRPVTHSNPAQTMPLLMAPVPAPSQPQGQARYIFLKTPTGNVLVPLPSTPTGPAPSPSRTLASLPTSSGISLLPPLMTPTLPPSSVPVIPKQGEGMATFSSPPSVTRTPRNKTPSTKKSKLSPISPASVRTAETQKPVEQASDSEVTAKKRKIPQTRTPPVSPGPKRRTRSSPRLKSTETVVIDADEESKPGEDNTSSHDSNTDLLSTSSEKPSQWARVKARRKRSMTRNKVTADKSGEATSRPPATVERPASPTRAADCTPPPPLLPFTLPDCVDTPVDSPASQSSGDVVTVPSTAKRSRIEELKAQLREKEAKLESLRQQRAEHKKVLET